MGEKKILIILGIVNVIILGALGGLYIKKDNVPPVITIEKDGFVYEESMNQEELLAGVSAVDPEDGDVSGTLVVEKVVPNAEKKMALITYGAMDSKGNMSKVSCKAEMLVERAEAEHPSEMLPVAGEAGAMEGLEVEETAVAEGVDRDEVVWEGENVPEENTQEDNLSEENDTPEREETPENQPERNEEPQEEPAQNEETPILRFGKTEVTTVKGQNPAWVNFIGELTDNKDNYEYLLNHLKIDGKYDRNKEGTYSVKVSTVDSDGNESKATSVTIEVK